MKRLLLLSCTVLFFTTCKNDLKLNAPYKEIPSIYAVFCPQDKLHIIRVNKVFLGEGDANVMAKVADSVNYPAGDLSISLDRYVNGVQVNACPTKGLKSIVFHDSIIQTQNGAFSTTQRVYVANADLHDGLPISGGTFSVNVNPNWRVYGDYVLTVKNNKTGNVFKAKSTIVDSVRQNGYPPFVGYYYPAPPGAPVTGDNFIDYSVSNATFTIRYSPNECKIYQLGMRFHFYDDLGASGKSYNYVDYNFNNQLETEKSMTAGNYYIAANFRGQDIFSLLGKSFASMNLNDNILGRKMYKLQFFVYGSTQDYADYLEFSKPSLNISQNKSLYSNFENQAAYGIFTFRSRSTFYKNMATSFVTEFQRNSNTCKFNFYNADESRHGCP